MRKVSLGRGRNKSKSGRSQLRRADKESCTGGTEMERGKTESKTRKDVREGETRRKERIGEEGGGRR